MGNHPPKHMYATGWLSWVKFDLKATPSCLSATIDSVDSVTAMLGVTVFKSIFHFNQPQLPHIWLRQQRLKGCAIYWSQLIYMLFSANSLLPKPSWPNNWIVISTQHPTSRCPTLYSPFHSQRRWFLISVFFHSMRFSAAALIIRKTIPYPCSVQPRYAALWYHLVQ